jgi:hypothetical protein
VASSRARARGCIRGYPRGEEGTRFGALEPIRRGVNARFGAFAAGVANGLTLRHDHTSVYMSNDFQTETKFLGIEPSPAFVRQPFVRQPEGNGCIERFFRTLKEQVLGSTASTISKSCGPLSSLSEIDITGFWSA